MSGPSDAGTYHAYDKSDIGLSNGSVPPGNKPLAELMLTKIYAAKWLDHSHGGLIWKNILGVHIMLPLLFFSYVFTLN